MEVKTKRKLKNNFRTNKKVKEENNRKKEIIIISIFLIIQTIIYVICGINKSYIHMDEAYSLGLASYDKVEIQDNADFYNTWHNKEYYEDYLSVQNDEIGEYKQVYENQKNDVHPPLYYLLLRFSMSLGNGQYSKWPGIVINIILFSFITIFMYLIIQKLFVNKVKAKEKSIILAFLSSITMASLTNVIYIRMYALSTLNILITTYLHLKLLEQKDVNLKIFILIGISALIGSLTHYYYLFYLAMLFMIFAIKYIKEKEFKKLSIYTLTMVVAAVLSLLIFPYSIQHMFFGYRGQGVISKLTDIPQFLTSISSYIQKVNVFGFNKLLYFLLAIIGILLYKRHKINNINKEKNNKLKIVYLPTLFYFIIVAIASPWVELRYIMPICGLIFVIVMYYLYNLLISVTSEKKGNIISVSLIVLILIMPVIYKIEPEVLFSDKKEIVSKLENELNVPTVYWFNSECNRFLDDILLFSKIDESYIAKDIEYTKENINNILRDKDISKGIVVFINENQDNDSIINAIKKATNLKTSEYLKRLNACDVYYLK